MDPRKKNRITDQDNKKKRIWIPEYVPPTEEVTLVTKPMPLTDYNEYMNEPVDRVFLTRNLPVEDGPLKIGDLVWSKFGNSPYWPAMVAVEPNRAQYCRIPPGVHYSAYDSYEYFVQYFGRTGSFGWNCYRKMINFEGYDRMVKLIKRQSKKADFDCDKDKDKDKIPKAKMTEAEKNDWNYAVCEAEKALLLTQEARINHLTFMFSVSDTKKEEEDEDTKMHLI